MGSQRFALDEVNELAAQVRKLQSSTTRLHREATIAQQATRDKHMSRAQASASRVRDQEELAKNARACRLQRRHTMPANVELCSTPCSGTAQHIDGYRASCQIGDVRRRGPLRKTIGAAESDAQRIMRMARTSGDAEAVRLIRSLEKEPTGAWK